jgi:HEAT repeat protein
MIRLVGPAALAAWLLATPAWAYLGTLQSLGQITGEAKHIVVLEVDRVSREKQVIIWKKVADLKGTYPTSVLKHHVAGGNDAREAEVILNWAEPGEIAIFFQNGAVAETCIGCCWYTCAAGQEAPWWTMTRIKFEQSYAYLGSPRKLHQHVTAILNRQEVVVTALDHNELPAYRYVALRDRPRGSQFPLWRIKAGLALGSWPKRGVPGAGGPEDVAALVEALRHKEQRVRADAADELGWIGPLAGEAVPVLTRALKDPDGLVRVRAAKALVEVDLKNQDALPVLLGTLKDKGGGLRKTAAEALGDLGPSARVAVPALIEALKDTDPRTRSAVVEALGQMGPWATAAVPALIAGLKDEALRNSAAGALGAIGPGARPAVPALAAALNDADEALRWTLVGSLVRIGGPAAETAVPVLVKAIASRHDQDRNCYQALTLLELMGPAGKDAAPVVIDGLKSGRLQPGWASTTLCSIDPGAALPFLLADLKGGDPVLRKYAAAYLGFSGPQARDALPILTKAAKADADAEVSRIAAWAVAMIQEDYQTAAPLLIQELKEDRAGYNHRFSAEAFQRWGPAASKAVPTLIGALLDKDPKVRRTTATVLGRIRPDARAAVPFLRKLLQDENRAVRMAADEALETILAGPRE